VIEQALVGAESGKRDRGAREVVERSRLRSEQGRWDRHIVGGGAIAVKREKRIDWVADRDAVGIGRNRGDDS
jgi:hypothetical protein